MHLRFLFALLSFLFLNTTGENADGENENENGRESKNDDKNQKPTFDETQQQHINDLIAAERKSTEERITARLRAEREEDERKATERKQREEQEKRGEFDQVKADLEGKVESAESELKTVKQRLEDALKVVETDIAARWKDVPERVQKLYEGDDDDPLAKATFLTKPAITDLIADLAAEQQPGHREDPKNRRDRQHDSNLPPALPHGQYI